MRQGRSFDRPELGEAIGSGVQGIAKGSGRLNYISAGITGLKLDQEAAAIATEAAAKKAFAETGGVARAPNGNIVVLPSQFQVSAWFEVTPEGQVAGMKGTIGIDDSADLNVSRLGLP